MIISKRYVIKINYGVSFHPYAMLRARIPASPKLCSYGKDLIVLSDGDVKKDVMKRIQEMNHKYLELQTK